MPGMYNGMVLLFLLLTVTYVGKASGGILFETTNAPVTTASTGATIIVNAIDKFYGASGRVVSMDYTDPTPNPCYGDNSCVVKVSVFTNNGLTATPYLQTAYPKTWSSTSNGANTIVPEVKTGKTMGELYTGLLRGGLVPGTEFPGTAMAYYCDPEWNNKNNCVVKEGRWQAYSKLCYVLAYTRASTSYITPFPGQSCIGPTPPHNSCSVASGSVLLDHGTLGVDEVNGNKKDQMVRIQCTISSKVNAYLISDNANDKIKLRNNGSLYSTVTLDGVPGMTGKTINVPVGGVDVRLESTLHTVGEVEIGEFKGNAILVVNII